MYAIGENDMFGYKRELVITELGINGFNCIYFSIKVLFGACVSLSERVLKTPAIMIKFMKIIERRI
jgi:hypothetical protein